MGLPLLPPEEARRAKETLSPQMVPKKHSVRNTTPCVDSFWSCHEKQTPLLGPSYRQLGRWTSAGGRAWQGAEAPIRPQAAPAQAGVRAWRGRRQPPAAARQGCKHLEAAQNDARAGSRSWDPNPLIFLSYCPLLLLLICHGARRAALELFFLLFSLISLLLLIFYVGDDAAFLRTQTFLAYLTGPGFR